MARTLVTGNILRSGSIPPAALPAGTITSSVQLANTLPVGTVSSSTQVNYSQLQNIPTDIVSSSTQVTAFLPANTVSSSGQIQLNSISGTTFSSNNFTFPQAVTASNVLITNVATVRELRTLFVTSSVIYESGSTKFGDSSEDTHEFTGSLFVHQGAIMNPSTLTANVTIPAGYNGLLVGPLTNQETITVENTATLTIV